jgi:hypothetical protein
MESERRVGYWNCGWHRPVRGRRDALPALPAARRLGRDARIPRRASRCSRASQSPAPRSARGRHDHGPAPFGRSTGHAAARLQRPRPRPLSRAEPHPALRADARCYWDKCSFCYYGLAETATASYREVPPERRGRSSRSSRSATA